PVARGGIETQCRKRQRRKSGRLLARADRGKSVACGGPGSPRRRGEPGAGIEALLAQSEGEVVEHRLLAAEQMGAARYVEEQAFGAVDGDQRRIAVAPVGQRFEQAAVSLGFRLDDVD